VAKRDEVPPDPSGIREPHDVLSAEEYPPPAAPDAETWQARARQLPPDPSGIEAAHDILAAEEFPPPAAPDVTRAAALGAPRRSWVPALGLGFALGVLVGRGRRR
jgi:hypothetical protein